jgi:hypothetical protein
MDEPAFSGAADCDATVACNAAIDGDAAAGRKAALERGATFERAPLLDHVAALDCERSTFTAFDGAAASVSSVLSRERDSCHRKRQHNPDDDDARACHARPLCNARARTS